MDLESCKPNKKVNLFSLSPSSASSVSMKLISNDFGNWEFLFNFHLCLARSPFFHVGAYAWTTL